jgi:hypothetical protein
MYAITGLMDVFKVIFFNALKDSSLKLLGIIFQLKNNDGDLVKSGHKKTAQ